MSIDWDKLRNTPIIPPHERKEWTALAGWQEQRDSGVRWNELTKSSTMDEAKAAMDVFKAELTKDGWHFDMLVGTNETEYWANEKLIGQKWILTIKWEQLS